MPFLFVVASALKQLWYYESSTGQDDFWASGDKILANRDSVFLLINVWVWLKWNPLLILRREQKEDRLHVRYFCHLVNKLNKQIEDIYETIKYFKLLIIIKRNAIKIA